MRSLLILVSLIGFASPLAAQTDVPLGLGQEGEDPPALLVPSQSRSEAEQDQLTAASMFAHGRLLYQREKYDAALRRYQRAYRYDPDATAILGEIVSLAFQLEHNEEAARYAVLAAERDPQNAQLLRRLAMHLTEKKDYARALKLYRTSLEMQKEIDDVTSVLLHMEIGRLHFLLEEFGPAAEAFTKVRDAILDPKKYGLSDELYKIVLGNAHATYALLGECFLRAKRYDDAEAMFAKANEAKADEAAFAYHVARIRNEQQRYDDALAQLDKYFGDKSSAAGVDAYDLLEEALTAKLGDKEAAQKQVLEKLTSLYADDADNHALAFAYAEALHTAGQDAKAIAVLTQSLDKEATLEVTGLLVELLHAQQKPGELLTVLGKSLGKTAALVTLGDAGEKLVADSDAISQLIAEAQRRKSAEPSTLTIGEALAMAMLSLKARQYDAAQEFFTIIVNAPRAAKAALSKSDAYVTWGLELYQADEFERAAKVFQEALEKNLPSQRKDLLRYFLASTYEMQGQTDKALATIDQALQGSKPPAAMLGRKGWIQYHARRYDDAEKTYLDLLAKWDSDHKTANVREAMREARMVMSNICIQTNRRAEGMEWLEQVLDEFPEDIGAMNDLGYLWAEDGVHLNRALRMLETAVAAEPDNHAYRDSLGWVYYQLKRYPEAIAELERAAAVETPDGVILDHLGDAYFAAGQLDKARDAWTRAVAAFETEKDTEHVQKTREKLQNNTSK
jgi:tetratricopeptide (TPR) repeat protein